MRVRWRGPLLCASHEAAGARDALRGLDAAGWRIEVQQTPWARPVAAAPEEIAWLAARQERLADAGVCIQRTLARHLDPHTASALAVGWITVPGISCDTETVLRAAAMDLVAVGTRRQASALVAAGIDPGRVIVLPDPVDPAVVRPEAPGPRAWDAAGPVIVAFTDGTWGGGWDLLVRAWARAAEAGDDVALVVLLDAPDPQADASAAGARALEALAAHGHDPDRLAELVVVPDPLDSAAVAGVLARARAAVVPARRDGYGRAAALARAAGVPVVGHHDDDAEIPVPWVPVPDPGIAPREDVRVRELHVDALADALRRALTRPLPDASSPRPHHRDVVADRLTHALRSARPHPRRRGSRQLAPRDANWREPAAGDGRPRLVLEGDLLGSTSLAGVNRALIAALVERGDVAVGALERDDRRVEPLDPRGAVAHAMRLSPGPADVVVRHFHPPSFAAPEAGRLVQVVHWEFGALPREWRDGLAGCDEVWVASAAVRDAVTGPHLPAERLRILPLAVDHPRWRNATPMHLGDDAPGYRFLYVGGLAWRKGADLLLEAYLRAFTRRDDVTLVVKDAGGDGRYAPDALSERWRAAATDPSGPRILRLTGALPETAMPGLYSACDCLVHPFRAEAFGLTMLEAAAAGLPVIASGHGPVREFLDDASADLLPSRGVVYPGTHIGPWSLAEPATVWEPSADDLAEAMRRRAAAPAEGRALGERAAAHVAGRTWHAAAAMVAGRVHALSGEMNRRSAA